MDRRISYLEKWIKSNLSIQHSVQEMAELVKLSKSRFDELFKAEIGKTPKEYLRDLRMEKAQELLKTTFKSIKEICFEVGIGDQRNFSREFKKRYGQTPTEYGSQFEVKLEIKETKNTKADDLPQDKSFYLKKSVDK